VPPWASPDEIRLRVRQLYRQLHPDTGALPDSDRLQRVKLIAEVLLNPEQRDRYNRTPPGQRLLDKVYRSELGALDFSRVPPERVEEMLRPPPTPTPTARWFDYLTVDRCRGDMHLAQRWYSHLVGVAPLVGYRRRVKVLLHDGPAFFHDETAVLAIPRSWTPSRALAFGLWVTVGGQRHPAWKAFSVRDMV
jgi:hypothetical protein